MTKSSLKRITFESFKLWGQLLFGVTLLLTIGIYTSGVVEYPSSPDRSQNRPSPENYVGVKVLRESFENSSMKGFNDTQPLTREVREETPESRQEERKPRQAQEPSSSSSSSASLQEDSMQSVIKNTSKNYYEEQMPVVVHAESEPRVSMSYRQPPSLPPRDIYADYAGDADAADDGDYNQPADYESSDAANYPDRGPQTYYDQDEYVAEGRSNSNPQYGESYKRLPPAPPGVNRKMQQRLDAGYKNRDFYNVYGDFNDYDYPPAEEYVKTQRKQQGQQQKQQQVHQQQQPQQTFQNYPSSQSLQSYHHRLQQQNGEFITSATPTSTTSRPTETTVLSVIKQLKNMWDLYRAFATAWNVVAERSQRREEEAQKQQQEQQEKQQQEKLQKQEKPQKPTQQRINARKPKPNITTPSSVQRRNGTEKTTAKTTTNTKVGTTTTKTKRPTTTTVQPTSGDEPRSDAASAVVGKKGDVGGRQQQHESERERRQTSEREKMNEGAAMDEKDSDSSVAAATRAEGRYIKGDPLKGYYDFVITEGSYKFWAAFQVGTAILVIYSTFAAIYYSKVNPLVSDYDYTDYLGGARALSGSDQDFIDDDDGDDDGDSDDDAVGGASSKAGKKRRTSRWMDWVPKMGHSVKFILDAIDKLPVEQV